MRAASFHRALKLSLTLIALVAAWELLCRALNIPVFLDLGHSLQASRWQTFWKFRIPSALPELFSGMKIAVTLAIIGAIIGEFVGGNRGLGYLIIVANQELDTPLAFAAIFLLSAAGIVLYLAIELLERVLIPWHLPSQPLASGASPL